MDEKRFDAIRLAGNDNVVCLLHDMLEGRRPNVDGLIIATLQQDTSLGHKVAISPIRHGEAVVKYGEVIGRATQDIAPGEHVHLHNLIGLGPVHTGAE